MEWVLPIETKLGERLGDGSTRDGGKSMAEVSAKINIKTQAKKRLKRQQKYRLYKTNKKETTLMKKLIPTKNVFGK